MTNRRRRKTSLAAIAFAAIALSLALGVSERASAAEQFWAFQPLHLQTPPVLHSRDAPKNPIDAFLLAKLQERGLSPAPAASRGRLVRRLYFDLLGLPPTPQQLSDALGDRAPDWYPRLVDRLLASPHYGERWARHWLDAARYADSDGFENDHDRVSAYPYRDFVIRALNDDLPYDQFLQWQLAGDELAPANPQAHVATGFLAASPYLETNTKLQSELDKNRYDELDDMIAATGQAMLGLTINCARCHDHKFDPIPTLDYYRLIATFASAHRIEMPLMNDRQRADFEGRKKAFDEKMTAAKNAGASKKEIAALEKSRPRPPSALVMTEDSATPVASYLLRRGDPANKVREIRAGFLTCLMRGDESQFVLTPPPGATTTFERAALAHWLTDVDRGAGALAARVAVNRLWQHHFGEGLVRTPGDFGAQGDRPSHPELLDYLAGQLIANHWSLKAVHRLILNSAAYQMDTAFDAANAKIDPDDRLLWRRRPMRLEAEALRDAILFTAGTLDEKMFGPGVKPPVTVAGRDKDDVVPRAKTEGPALWRRTVYVFVKRSLPVPMLEAFDAPNGNAPCTRRLTTTVAPQALAMLNDPFVRIQAEHFASRVKKEASDDASSRIRRAYTLALSRDPSSGELADAIQFLGPTPSADEKLVDFCQVLLGLNEFAYID